VWSSHGVELAVTIAEVFHIGFTKLHVGQALSPGLFASAFEQPIG